MHVHRRSCIVTFLTICMFANFSKAFQIWLYNSWSWLQKERHSFKINSKPLVPSNGVWGEERGGRGWLHPLADDQCTGGAGPVGCWSVAADKFSSMPGGVSSCGGCSWRLEWLWYRCCRKVCAEEELEEGVVTEYYGMFCLSWHFELEDVCWRQSFDGSKS